MIKPWIFQYKEIEEKRKNLNKKLKRNFQSIRSNQGE